MADLSPESNGEEESPLEEIIVGAVTGVTLLVGFGLMALGFQFFWIAFVVGFAGILPMALGLLHYYQDQNESSRSVAMTEDQTNETEDALDELRRRYARGEFSDEEFERRVERLLETESVADARKYTEREPVQRERELDRE